jgi:hypothetical protein
MMGLTALVAAAMVYVFVIKMRGGLPIHLAVATVTVVLFWAAAGSTLRFPRLGSALIVLLSMAELGLFAVQYMRYTPDDKIYSAVPLLTELPTDPAAGRGMTDTENGQNFLYGEWAPVVHARNIQGSNPLMLQETMEYLVTSASGTPPNNKQQLGLLEHDGFFTQNPLQHNPMLSMLDMRWGMGGQNRRDVLEKVSGGFGPGWAVGGTTIMDRSSELSKLSHNLVDAHQVVLLENPIPGLPANAPPEAIQADIHFISYTPDRIEYSIDMPKDGIVITSEVFYPGWRCELDGVETPMYRAYGLLRAFRVSAGHHQAVVQLVPYWLFAFPISGTAIVLALVAMLWPREKPRPVSNASADELGAGGGSKAP